MSLFKKTVVLGSLLASGAFAQALPQADIEQVWLDPAGRGSLLVGNGLTLKSLDFRVAAAFTYAHAPFKSYRDQAPAELISDRLGVQVTGALGVTDWLELGANVPVYFAQWSAKNFPTAKAGLGNPWLSARIGLLNKTRPVSLSFGVGVGIPVGTGSAQGNGGIEVAPSVTLGKVFNDFQVSVEAGGLLRQTVDFSGITGIASDKVGSQISLAAMVAGVNASGPRGEFSVRGYVPLTGARPGVEGQFGVRWPLKDVELFASVGPGFFGEPTTPQIRGYLGAAFANTPLTLPPCVEGQPYEIAECPDLDKDGDGITNALDQAPAEAEDKDSFEDTDGKPDPDNDADGVLDGADKCPQVAGLAENQGCPDVDTDKDGIVDRLDKCPKVAEDKDEFEDSDGCPELDNDGDTVPDATDACPLVTGVVEEKGCPVKDSDADGVNDPVDNCPAEKGVPENQGCPAAQKQLVVITKESLKILDKVYFDTGKGSIQKKSFLLLDQIANVLNGHPEIALIQVEGHTDNVGKPEKNKKLSQDRAEAVKAYLVKKGVVETRLKPAGFGDEKPSADNKTPAGREANRRVEFNIVSK